MRLGHKIFLLFLGVVLPLGFIMGRRLRSDVHAVMVRNISAAGRASAEEASKSTAIGLMAADREPLRKYLEGCLQGFAADYALAVDADGRVVAKVPETVLLGPDPDHGLGRTGSSTQPFTREIAAGGQNHLELVIPAEAGSAAGRPLGRLILGFSMDEVAATEDRIQRNFLAFAVISAGSALAVYWVLMTMIIRREEELVKKDRALLQSEKLSALGRLAAGIAHEVNNPLGSILVFAQAAGEKVPETDPLSGPLKAIAEEALRAKRLVSDLLAFSRRSDWVAESFLLDDALKAALAMAETQARLKKVEMRLELGFGRELRGHRGQVQQATLNLCNNAMDAMPQGGSLTVRTRASADSRSAVIEVEDTGSGIPRDLQKWVFEPFFTTKEVGQGTGLGLALVHEIAVRHGGAVEFTSAPGRGTIFTMTLPVRPPDAGERRS